MLKQYNNKLPDRVRDMTNSEFLNWLMKKINWAVYKPHAKEAAEKRIEVLLNGTKE